MRLKQPGDSWGWICNVSNSLYIFESNSVPAVTAVMATSGTFVMNQPVTPLNEYPGGYSSAASSYSVKVEVANPMTTQPVQYTVRESAPAQFTYELKEAYKGARIISTEALDGYADQLVAIGKTLAAQPIDLMIVPFRGGLTPSLQLQVINKLSYPTLPLGFSAGSQPQNWKRIGDELVASLEKYRERSSLVIGVIDAAVRGDSSLSLANIMRELKAHFGGQPWRVVFHLLYSDEKYSTPFLANGIPGLSVDEIVFEVVLHKVPSLLVDDWNEGIGLRADWKNGVCYYKKTSSGHILAKQPDGSVAVLESPELPRLLDSPIAQSVTDSMLSDPNLRLKPNNEKLM